MKFLTSLITVLFFLSFSVPSAYGVSLNDQRKNLLRQRMAIAEKLEQAQQAGQKTSTFRREYREITTTIRRLQRKIRKQKQAQKRKSLQTVSLKRATTKSASAPPLESIKTNKRVTSASERRQRRLKLVELRKRARQGANDHGYDSLYYEEGIASYYHHTLEGELTASGERFSNSAMTAAHKALPFGSLVRVTNLDNGKSVVVTINDRGPFVVERIIDLSKYAFSLLDNVSRGVLRVKVELVE